MERTVARDRTVQGAIQGELDWQEISRARVQGDCLYLHCHGESASRILRAIATSPASVMLSEGIRHVKLHGKRWALAVDMPIDRAAAIASEVVALLAGSKLPGTSHPLPPVKAILRHDTLHLLFEPPDTLRREVLLVPILAALRQAGDPGEPLRAHIRLATVICRPRGMAGVAWTFEIASHAIGEANAAMGDRADPACDPLAEFELDGEEGVGGSLPWYRSWHSARQAIAAWPWRQWMAIAWDTARNGSEGLRQLVVQQPNQDSDLATFAPSISTVACLCALGLGLTATLVLDRTLTRYAKRQPVPSAAPPALSAAEAAIIARPLPDFNNAYLNQKLALLEWHVSAFRQPPDVLIVGSSRALRGIDPSALEAALAARGVAGVKVFNLGVNGATAKVVELQVLRLLGRDRLPRLILWADGLRAFNSSRPDLTYRDIAASPGYAQLTAASLEGTTADPSTGKGARPPGARKLPLEQWIEAVLAAYPQRDRVRAAVLQGYERTARAFDDSQALIEAGVPSASLEVDRKGFAAVDVVFEPQTYFQTHPRVSGDFDLDYRDFEFRGQQIDSLEALARFCWRQGIPLVLVNMPLHETYLDPPRSRLEAAFSEKMAILGKRWQFGYIDLTRAWPQQSSYFSDPSHLNRYGAAAIAEVLAQRADIPWHKAIPTATVPSEKENVP